MSHVVEVLHGEKRRVVRGLFDDRQDLSLLDEVDALGTDAEIPQIPKSFAWSLAASIAETTPAPMMSGVWT